MGGKHGKAEGGGSAKYVPVAAHATPGRSSLSSGLDDDVEPTAAHYQQPSLFAPRDDQRATARPSIFDRAKAGIHDVGSTIDDVASQVVKGAAAVGDTVADKASDAAGSLAGAYIDDALPASGLPGTKTSLSLTTKLDMHVLAGELPLNIAAGASVELARTTKSYTVTLAGDAFVGVGASTAQAAGGAPSLSVGGTLPAGAMHHEHAPAGSPFSSGLPGGVLSTKVGSNLDKTAALMKNPSAAGVKNAARGEVSAEAGAKVKASLTYTFDASPEKNRDSDGLGGATALIAIVGAGTAAHVALAPFGIPGGVIAGAGLAIFADRLTSVSVTGAKKVGAQADGSIGGLGEANAQGSMELGATLKYERAIGADSGQQTMTYFAKLGGEGSAALAPGVGKLLGGAVSVEGVAECMLRFASGSQQTIENVSARVALKGGYTASAFPRFLDAVPPHIRSAIQANLARLPAEVTQVLPNATDATIEVEVELVLGKLLELAKRIEALLSRDPELSQLGELWNIILDYAHSSSCKLGVKATLKLREQMLDIKGGASQSGLSLKGKLALARGYEAELYPGKVPPPPLPRSRDLD